MDPFDVPRPWHYDVDGIRPGAFVALVAPGRVTVDVDGPGLVARRGETRLFGRPKPGAFAVGAVVTGVVGRWRAVGEPWPVDGESAIDLRRQLARDPSPMSRRGVFAHVSVDGDGSVRAGSDLLGFGPLYFGSEGGASAVGTHAGLVWRALHPRARWSSSVDVDEFGWFSMGSFRLTDATAYSGVRLAHPGQVVHLGGPGRVGIEVRQVVRPWAGGYPTRAELGCFVLAEMDDAIGAAVEAAPESTVTIDLTSRRQGQSACARSCGRGRATRLDNFSDIWRTCDPGRAGGGTPCSTPRFGPSNRGSSASSLGRAR